MNVNKKFDRFKQWAGERMGGEAKTNLSDDFKALEAEMNLRHEGMDRLHKSMTAYIKAISKRSEGEDKEKTLPIAHLGSCMVNHGEEFDTNSQFGQCLILCGRTHERLARMQESYVMQATSSWLESLERSLAQMKDYQLENRRLAYDAALAKMQKAKKEDSRIEEEFRTQKAKYEEANEDVYRRMQDIKASEADSISDLTSFLEAELNFHERCREVLLQLKNDWPALQSQAQTPNGRRTGRLRSNTAHSFHERYESVKEEPSAASPAPRHSIKSNRYSISNPLDTSSREFSSDSAPQRPVLNRAPTFEGPTQLRGDPSPATSQAPSGASNENLSIRTARSSLRPVSKIYGDTFDPQDDSASYGSPYDERSASPATSQGSAFSRTPSSTTVNSVIGKKPPPPPPSRAKKPPPPPPPTKRNLVGACDV
ncbi:BAR domain protein [Rasamsonia emersonii CBS 393.64]|uniref:BAR domain protein n=1 Tax=Rasamsonia emersonii (strain ATCC 16479 / CBS 393.64 / IMI 116815) TaxID=1408163 RepID=A0A0F4YUJ8_RASE3|nr:BAR domain protein [Rasamsonia emersonii CBS 393.64]KKA21909.1 BAR domain protein [Rasamsonia emersonii CBS 393.64]